MQKTSGTSPRSRRFRIWSTTVASAAALLAAGGCQGEEDFDDAAPPPYSGSGVMAGVGGGALAASRGGSTGSGLGTGGSASRGDMSGSGISLAGGGGSSATLGGTAGTSGVAPRPCVDTPPPFNAEWPDATCEDWATQTTECSAGWFSQYCDVSCGRCIPEGGSTIPQPPDCSGENLPNVTGGEGFATRYWDCCQTHCAAQGSAPRCAADGVTRTGDTQSACSTNNGGSFACYSEAPRAVSECLSYGHIAKANPNCGGCFRIQFTGEGEHNRNDIGSSLLKGKQMIVKVSNTGSDVGGNQFDLMVPGGGVGMFNACSRQWNQSDLGEQFGGFLADCTGTHAQKKDCVRRECMKIPAGPAREGCFWFVDWFQIADNPRFTSQATNCPF